MEDRYSMIDTFGEHITFTESQRRCIDYCSDNVLVIKGTAGSGKSMMVIKRAMLDRKDILERGARDHVVLFTYTDALTKGLCDILKMNDVDIPDDVISVSKVDTYLTYLCKHKGLLPKDNNFKTQKDQKHGSNKTWKGGKWVPDNSMNDSRRSEVIASIIKRQMMEDDHPYYHRDVTFWVNEVLWMYQNGIVDADDRDAYMKMSREGRCKNYNTRLNQKGREIAFRIFSEYNRYIVDHGLVEWDRMYAILYRYHMGDIDNRFKFEHIYIDEAQDLTLVKMSLILSLGIGTISIAMDKNQSIYGHRWSFKRDLGISSHVKTLEVMHRSSREIDVLSQDLKRVDDTLLDSDDIYENELSPKESGLKPNVVRCKSPDSEMEFIINVARSQMDSNVTTAILCQDYKHLRAYETKMRKEGIPFQFFRDSDFSYVSPGIKLCTLHSAKGLGFRNVIIPNFEEGVFPKSVENVIGSINQNRGPSDEELDVDKAMAEEISDTRRLAYVGITRAMRGLWITYSGMPSRFLSEFQRNHYDLIDEAYNRTEDVNILDVFIPEPRRVTFIRDSMDSVSVDIHLSDSFDSIDHHEMFGFEATEPQQSMLSDQLDDHPEVCSSPIVGDSTIESESDVVIEALIDAGLEYYDRRDRDGALWVVNGPNVAETLEMLDGMGYQFKYKASGNRVTGHRAAYYLR